MKSRALFIFALACLSVNWGCKKVVTNEPDLANPQYFIESMEALSDVIVYDIFSPPVASRNYAYPSIAAYEVMSASNDRYQSLAGQITGFTAGPTPPTEEYSPAVATLAAFIETARNFIFSEEKLDNHKDKLYTQLKVQGISDQVFDRSVAYGTSMAQHVIKYSQGDNYKQSRTFPKYSITTDPSQWKPTPPGYMDGIEPHWSTIRPFVIDSSQQFTPLPPTTFDMTKGSKFYNETVEVYEIGKNADDEQKEIAAFWDCNPYKLNVTGHVMHATKKITPGGHWIGIIGLACTKDNADWAKTIEAYTLTSLTMADAFISCWDEKYRSNLIRPETVINEYIDESWVPFLQTPPFPEHTSGHSVVSRSAAVALTSIFGDNFEYDDTVELVYGLPKRSFKSFYKASEEAAISRLYGGIHYRPAIDYGVAQGEKVGNYVVNKLKLKS
jgi:hypothetical protein